MAVLFVVLAKGVYDDALQLRDEGVETVATVTAVDTFGRNAGIVVEFTMPSHEAGEVFEVELGLPDTAPAVGDEIQVVYVPDEPWLAELAGNGPNFVLPWFVAALAAVWLVLGVFSFAGRINWRWVAGVYPHDDTDVR